LYYKKDEIPLYCILKKGIEFRGGVQIIAIRPCPANLGVFKAFFEALI
jgi:hypothetical protein